ncbi:histidine-rich glycoprotein-like [Liolophura sinensis]|uniref:histidine-rich glycoprotein-like n=1 Tax=Liolophura sinensis TaxID=3198878 RepID=UPI003159414E
MKVTAFAVIVGLVGPCLALRIPSKEILTDGENMPTIDHPEKDPSSHAFFPQDLDSHHQDDPLTDPYGEYYPDHRNTYEQQPREPFLERNSDQQDSHRPYPYDDNSNGYHGSYPYKQHAYNDYNSDHSYPYKQHAYNDYNSDHRYPYDHYPNNEYNFEHHDPYNHYPYNVYYSGQRYPYGHYPYNVYNFDHHDPYHHYPYNVYYSGHRYSYGHYPYNVYNFDHHDPYDLYPYNLYYSDHRYPFEHLPDDYKNLDYYQHHYGHKKTYWCPCQNLHRNGDTDTTEEN